MILILTPTAFILAERMVPSEKSCWMLVLSGVIYYTVCGCGEGRFALIEGIVVACICATLILLSASGSRPLEKYKKSEDGFYAHTRAFIKTDGIQALQDKIEEIKTEIEDQENDGEESESIDADDIEEPEDILQGDSKQEEPESVFNEENYPDLSVEVPENAVDAPVFSAEDTVDSEGNETETKESESMEGGNGSTANLPDLNVLSRFQPDAGTRLTLTLDKKPEETVYYPSVYGVRYAESRWSALSLEREQLIEECRKYPDGLEELAALCQENTARKLSETSDFIQREFEKNTVYDYEPGTTPPGEDFAEYFLFVNQRGFCVHFATTAVLMYRMCGYPARYVQGYAVPASAFQRQADGRYKAEVTGEMGHAWCEVYNEDEWMLKEHTLPYYGTRPERGIPATSARDRSWIRSAAGWRLLILKISIGCLLCFASIFLVLFLQASFRRKRRKHRVFRKGCGGEGIRRVYRAVYDAAVFQGMQKTDILSRSGFTMLRDSLPETSSDSMEWLYQTVMETMFYQRTVTRQDTQRAWQIYRQASQSIKKGLRGHRKFIYCYIKAF